MKKIYWCKQHCRAKNIRGNIAITYREHFYKMIEQNITRNKTKEFDKDKS